MSCKPLAFLVQLQLLVHCKHPNKDFLSDLIADGIEQKSANYDPPVNPAGYLLWIPYTKHGYPHSSIPQSCFPAIGAERVAW